VATVEHVPVLYGATIDGLAPRPGGAYIDCTLGSGGHAEGILAASAPDGTLLGLDADPEALARAGARLLPFGARAHLVQANFRDLEAVTRREEWPPADGILLDLGVSSVQLGTAARGFSFQEDGPLDMRLDPTRGSTAAVLIAELEERDLAALLRRYGDEPRANTIAAAIVRERARAPIVSTAALANLVTRVKGRHGRIHPATTVFQALRIAVNGELESLEAVLPQTLRLLRPGGRLAVIAFHSLEDRIVKQFMHEEARTCRCPPEQPICTCARRPAVRLLSRHAIMPGADEVRANPRARSARLRLAERL
jgi:16S rRNA (cytosine1402-N4)-methyltransferase